MSPKFFVGESYGGFRGPPLAQKLQNDQGIGLSGLVLLSPVLRFRLVEQGPAGAPWMQCGAAALPGGSETRRQGRGDSRDALKDGGGLRLGRVPRRSHAGLQDKEAVERVSRRVAELKRARS